WYLHKYRNLYDINEIKWCARQTMMKEHSYNQSKNPKPSQWYIYRAVPMSRWSVNYADKTTNRQQQSSEESVKECAENQTKNKEVLKYKRIHPTNMKATKRSCTKRTRVSDRSRVSSAHSGALGSATRGL